MTAFEVSLVLASALLHALWNAYTKQSESPLAYLGWVHVLTCVAALALLPLVELGEVPTRVWIALGAAGCIHTAYMIFLSLAYERGDLAVVYPIARSAPALMPLLAIPLLGERLSWAGAAGILVVVAGFWAIQTGGRRLGWRVLGAPGTGFAYLTLLATLGYSLVDKTAMVQFGNAPWTSPVPIAVFYYLALTPPILLLYLPYALWRTPVSTWRRVWAADAGRILIGTVAAFVSYALILEALRTAAVSYVTAVRQTSVLFALVLGFVVLRERPGRVRALGALATVAGVIVIVLAG